MKKWLFIAITAIAVYDWPHLSSAQCGFAITPAANIKWYRENGWETPGVADAKSIAKFNVTINGKPKVWPDGITVSVIEHEKDYRVSFPEAIFNDEGIQKKMLSRTFHLVQLLRWEMNGKPYAYSYYLLPYDVACDSSIDIVDDKGDGKFRLITSPGHPVVSINPLPPPVPGWLMTPKS
jgi:hypothetical protein